jgi:hypothetical protein
VLATIALCLVFVFTRQEHRFWSTYTGRFVSPADVIEDLVRSAGYANLPVVLSPAANLLQLAHYAPAESANRFVAIADAEKAIIYSRTDSVDKQLEVLRHYAPLQIYDFKPFVAEHPVFLLYSGGGGAGWDWWPGRLLADGFTLREVAARDVYHKVFLVSRDKDLK